MTDETITNTDLMPLAERCTVARHKDILDGLRLDLKIAADGYPELKAMSAEDICRSLQGMKGKRGRQLSQLYNAAAAVYCHELYFRHIVGSDSYPSLPKGSCSEMLRENFNSAGGFFYLVRTVAGSTSAPGFLWLYEKHTHKKTMLGLARLPLYSLLDLRSVSPLMCIDLWEHAYIDRWGRDISGYADACLRQIDWESVMSQIHR